MVCQRGFSLIELLVVIVIVAILFGMLLPVVELVRSAARRSVCSSQQRQILMAVIAYAGDQDGWLPDASRADQRNWISATADKLSTGSWWFSWSAGSDFAVRKIYLCPEGWSQQWLGISYVYHRRVGLDVAGLPTYPSVQIERVKQKSDAVLLMDGTNKSSGAIGFEYNASFVPNCVDYRHRGQVMAGYVDGHAAAIGRPWTLPASAVTWPQ